MKALLFAIALLSPFFATANELVDPAATELSIFTSPQVPLVLIENISEVPGVADCPSGRIFTINAGGAFAFKRLLVEIIDAKEVEGSVPDPWYFEINEVFSQPSEISLVKVKNHCELQVNVQVATDTTPEGEPVLNVATKKFRLILNQSNELLTVIQLP